MNGSWWSLQKLYESLLMNFQIAQKLTTSRPVDLEPPFVNIAPRMTQDSLISSNANRWIVLNGPSRWVTGADSLGSPECFCFIKSSVLLDSWRIPFDMLFVNSFKAPFTFPCSLELWIFFGYFGDVCSVFRSFQVVFKRSVIVWPYSNS